MTPRGRHPVASPTISAVKAPLAAVCSNWPEAPSSVASRPRSCTPAHRQARPALRRPEARPRSRMRWWTPPALSRPRRTTTPLSAGAQAPVIDGWGWGLFTERVRSYGYDRAEPSIRRASAGQSGAARLTGRPGPHGVVVGRDCARPVGGGIPDGDQKRIFSRLTGRRRQEQTGSARRLGPDPFQYRLADTPSSEVKARRKCRALMWSRSAKAGGESCFCRRRHSARRRPDPDSRQPLRVSRRVDIAECRAGAARLAITDASVFGPARR